MSRIKIKDNSRIPKESLSGISLLTSKIADKTLEQLEKEIRPIPLDTHITENIVNCRACVYLSYSIRNIRLEWEARRYMDCSLMAHGSGKSI